MAREGRKQIRDALLSLLFPKGANCLCCAHPRLAQEEDSLCPACREALQAMRLPPQACNRCLSYVKAGNKCSFCASSVMQDIDRVFAPWRYGAQVRALIHAFKFDACDEALPTLVRFMAESLTERDFDCIVPVPLHRRRLKTRGVNQSLLLAQGLSACIGVPVKELLQRDVYRAPQSTLEKEARKSNVAGAFSCREDAKGLRVLLVDDVRTGGYTAHECARALKQGGALRICLCTAAVVYRAAEKKY